MIHLTYLLLEFLSYQDDLVNKNYRVYTLLGDGEIQEGQVWEASMFASHRGLDNLCVIVDNNGLQIDCSIQDVCSPYPNEAFLDILER